MWFVGLLIGAIVGALGGPAGAVGGALIGALAGWALSANRMAPVTDRLRDIEDAIERLNQRVEVLERAPATAEGTVAMPVVESQVSASGDTFSEQVVSTETTVEPQAPVVPAHPVEAAPESAAQPVADDGEPAFAPETSIAGATTTSRPQRPSALWNFLLGGNTLVRVGVVVLFFGVAFLLKYAAEHVYIPIEARLMGVALGAIVMLAIGWRLRLSRPGYGLIMQGGGIGVLYLTVFASFRLYQLLPSGLVLGLLAAMAVFSAMLAVMQDARSLAAMGVSGGFLAPLLASTGGGSHVMLFSFYALLNLGIVVIAWYKAWRSLNLLGFIFTFAIGLLWGSRDYRPELFASTEPFLILFFVFYVAIAVLFAMRQEASIKDRVDGTLVFGTPLVAFGLQTALVRDFEYGAAFSALALSCFYLMLAKALYARSGANLRLLVESFIALGLVFGTLAIPLGLDGRWTSAAWALEGAAIVWVGVRQEKRWARAFGVALQFAAGVAFLIDAAGPRAVLPVLNSFYLGCVFISVAGLFCNWYLGRHRRRLNVAEGLVASVLFYWGALWWFGAGINETQEHVASVYRAHAVLLFVIASCSAFSILRRRMEWREASYPPLALLVVLYVMALIDAARDTHPFGHLGYVVWPLGFAAHFWLLHRHEDDARQIRWWHAAGVWLFAGLAAWELAWLIGDMVQGGQAWRLIGWALAPAVLLAWLALRGERLTWPVARHLEAYLCDGAVLLAAYLWLWMHYANFQSNGDAAPLPYLPFLNPLDLAQAGALLVLYAWFQRIQAAAFAPPDLKSAKLASCVLGSAAFVWVNGVLLRTLHHWAAVPFEVDAMLRSMLVQAAFSIFWSVLALCTMLSATRLRLRPLWLTGAALMAVVVVKLFFVDLSNVGGIERIVSFIGVGLLMLVIGYASPVPPSTTGEAK